MKVWIATAICGALLAGCATGPTYYQSANSYDRGYYDRGYYGSYYNRSYASPSNAAPGGAYYNFRDHGQ
jgi:hypothetical protein